jgi:hypothetical protein
MRLRELQRTAVDAIKRHALVLSTRSPRAQAQILQEYLWTEEGAEATTLERVANDAPPWLDKLATRHLADEERHAQLFRDRLVELGVPRTRPPPKILTAKMWWLDRAVTPFKTAFAAGPIVVLLSVAAQLESTGVRMFGRHLAVLEQLSPDNPTTALLRSVLHDEKRHAKSCRAAARKLVRPEELAQLQRLEDKIAEIDRAFGVTISIGFWLTVAVNVMRDRRAPQAVSTLIKAAA